MRNKHNETNADSVAVGTIFYKNSDRTGHAVNAFISPDENVSFFEPRDGLFISLTEAEENKVWYVNF